MSDRPINILPHLGFISPPQLSNKLTHKTPNDQSLSLSLSLSKDAIKREQRETSLSLRSRRELNPSESQSQLEEEEEEEKWGFSLSSDAFSSLLSSSSPLGKRKLSVSLSQIRFARVLFFLGFVFCSDCRFIVVVVDSDRVIQWHGEMFFLFVCLFVCLCL